MSASDCVLAAEVRTGVELGTAKPVRTFALSLRSCTVELCTLGASITKFLVDDVEGATDDIVLGYTDAMSMYTSGNPVYFSSVVGRVANRIAKGRFSVGGDVVDLEINSPPNHLHGGSNGYSHMIWDGEIIQRGDMPFVRFSLESPSDEGYPGSVKVTATYSLRPSPLSSSGVVLSATFSAHLLSDHSTPVNISQHTYFNLSGQSGPRGILDHHLCLESDAYCPVDESSIPTREVRSVAKEPAMDWREERTFQEALESFGVNMAGLPLERVAEDLKQRAPLSEPYGFDHNYVIREQPGTSLAKVGTLVHEKRRLVVYSDAPGVQVYTANHLGETEIPPLCKGAYGPWAGICLETQHFPDSIDEGLEATSDFGRGKCCILSPKSPDYEHTVEYSLEVDGGPASGFAGSDTEGNAFESIEAMWYAQDLSSWYVRARVYYEENCTATIDGVLGGIGWISDVDLKGSRDFMRSVPLPSSTTPTVACECGAGIGRVTKGLLLDLCDRCDLLESSTHLLNAAPDHIGNKCDQCRYLSSELQEWMPTKGRYTLIWIQWVLSYLTDTDIVVFLKRCSSSLVPGGVIVLKENSCVDESFVVDVDDASVTRSIPYWKDLIFKANLVCVKQTLQDEFPDEIFPVHILALQPANNIF